MEDYIQDKNLNKFEEYTILGKNLATLVVQVGYVEENKVTNIIFNNLTEYYQTIFKNNKEYCVISWNGIPFRLNYSEDLPFIINPLINILDKLINSSVKIFQHDFKSKNLDIQFFFQVDDNDIIEIKAKFNKVLGNHNTALNKLSIIKIKKNIFLREWKLLLEQFVEVDNIFNPKFKSKESKKQIKKILEINSKIENRAKRYQYDLRK